MVIQVPRGEILSTHPGTTSPYPPSFTHPSHSLYLCIRSRAVVYDQSGQSDVLHVASDVIAPATPEDGIRVRVLAAGINPVDVKLRKFHLPK